ncbi:MAG: peroxiredoxin [Armatimonadota bacterium]|jgi:peroxiredoxin Q/BCP|nr:peroxiredoxin [Armatimonadota bacterium]
MKWIFHAVAFVLASGFVVRAAETPAPPALKVGDPAPDFKLTASNGKEYTLKEFKGKSAVILAWYPKAMTGGCTTECNAIRDEMTALSQFKVQVFGASTDPVEANKEFANRQGYTFPLLSDPDRAVAAAYGVLAPNGKNALRWTFVIDDKGIIRHIDREVKPATHGKDLARVLAELKIPRR